jgi:hypothetical protein
MFHQNAVAAREIYDAPTPGLAKSIAKKHFGKCSSAWNNIKFRVMQDIMWEKAGQCKLFREKLMKSGAMLLVHNMESDPIWGFGANGHGCDEMGKILMRVRDRLVNATTLHASHVGSVKVQSHIVQPNQPRERRWSMVMQSNSKSHSTSANIPTKPTTVNNRNGGSGGVKPKVRNGARTNPEVLLPGGTKRAEARRIGGQCPGDTAVSDGTSSKMYPGSISGDKSREDAASTSNIVLKYNPPTIAVIGNSNVQGITAELNSMGVNTTGYMYKGVPSEQIKDRLKHCKGKKVASHIFLHTGDIDARNNPRGAVDSVIRTIDEAMNVYSHSRIFIDTLSENVSDQKLRENLRAVNEAIAVKCRSNPELTLIDSSDLRLRDGIHFTSESAKAIARNVLNCIHYSNV